MKQALDSCSSAPVDPFAEPAWLVCDADVVTGEVARRSEAEAGGGYAAVWLLSRCDGEPVAVSTHPLRDHGDVSDSDVLAMARRTLAGSAGAAGPVGGARAAVRDPALLPPLSVVVCTRRRPEDLRRCLDSLTRQTHPRYEIVIVDNDPSADSARAVVDEAAAGSAVPVRYVRETTAGLSYARNAGAAAARYAHLACLDDDEEADAGWLTEVATAFLLNPGCEVVTGPMFPARLTTSAQIMFEKFGGHNKGRQLSRAVLSKHTVEPCFPLPAFGTGGNMAFTLAALQRVGMFDVALGAGTRPGGAEDTLFLSQHLLVGGSIAYEPRVLVWHHHRRTMEELVVQLRGYGRGLTAYYTSLLLWRPRLLPHLLSLVPRGLREVLSDDGLRASGTAEDFPAELLDGNRREMLAGPRAYLHARWCQSRRTARATAP